MGFVIKYAVLIVATLQVHSVLQAQSSTNSNGGSINGSGVHVSYSIGQVNYQQHIEGSYSITEGVQQNISMEIVSALNEEKLMVNVNIFPIPSTDQLHVYSSKITEGAIIQLFDFNGLKVLEAPLIETNQIIEMRNLSPAIYLLKILFNNTEQQTFKIIKK